MYQLNKHKGNRITTLLLITAVLCQFACSRQLDILPTDQIDGDHVFNSVNSVEQGVLGVYAGWEEELQLQTGAVPADECRIGLKNAGVNGAAQNLFRWTFTTGDKEVAAPWTNAYQTINRANRILAVIDQVPVSGDAEAAQKRALKGELLAIRAFEHFELYRTYGYSPVYKADAPAVPYVTGTGTDSKPSRPLTAAFFSQLNTDLAAADTLLTSRTDITRMGLTALYALEARIAVYTGNWNEAINKAGQVMAQVPLAQRADFPQIWTDQGNTEVIFKLRRTNQSPLRPGDIWRNTSLGIIYFAPALKLLQCYDANADIRYNSYFSNDPSLAADGQLPDIIKKYAGADGALNLNDVKVFRTAEMYLARAEAYVHTGNLQAAAADLNTLRAARIRGYTPEQFSDATTLLNAILLERYKELAFEGHRYYDLRRTGHNIERIAADLPSGMTNAVLTPADNAYYMPIPQAELLANPSIQPNNPGW